MFSKFTKSNGNSTTQTHESTNKQTKPQSDSILKRYEETVAAWRDKQKSEGRLRNTA